MRALQFVRAAGRSVIWRASHRFDPAALPLADRHYNRQKPGTPQFVPPGRCVVLVAGEPVSALWVTSWPFAAYTKHAWAGAWVCSLFRNEGAGLSSQLIREAVAATRAVFGEPPALGMVTFVDATKIRSTNPGACYLRAGFRRLKERTKEHGHIVLQMLPEDMPDAEPAIGASAALFGAVA